ncbi:hypothetical protein CDL12_04763 [Handroanthus impetiginosus]|uniref:Uncharacterized protein n=1 Tax=Handroanthus impetiginosus TaxID=429701 RepID=A0A2G9HYF0_9LAMI|nr:hypothetical protein CDL12_04763 [Handroanthus impetiginosus]
MSLFGKLFSMRRLQIGVMIRDLDFAFEIWLQRKAQLETLKFPMKKDLKLACITLSLISTNSDLSKRTVMHINSLAKLGCWIGK